MPHGLRLWSLIFLVTLSQASAAAGLPDELIQSHGRLIFEDRFDRSEADDSKEQLGNGWVTNSKRRAQGVKQGDLKDGMLVITMASVADHGVSIKHDAPFDDGVVRVRFRIHDGKGIGFNFNDPACKSSHAGHICHVGVKPGAVDLRDGKTGIFEKSIRARRLAGASKEEIARLTKGRFAHAKADVETGRWYEMTIVIRGDEMTVWIDGQQTGRLKSPGIDHEVKQNIAFAVSGTADVDDLRIWSLSKK